MALKSTAGKVTTTSKVSARQALTSDLEVVGASRSASPAHPAEVICVPGSIQSWGINLRGYDGKGRG